MTNVIQIPQLPTVAGASPFAALEAVQAGVSVQISILQILALLPTSGGSTSLAFLPCRIVTADANSNFLSTDTGLLINKTIAGATSCVLPSPPITVGRMIFIKDMKGDAGTNNITLDAGSGNLINGQQTLVMDANYGTTMLIGMSSTQWGTLI